MCQLFESIRLEDGVLQYLPLHEARMQKSRKDLWNLTDQINLSEIDISNEYKTGLYKCRITYKNSVESIQFIPYQIRTIKSIKLVESDHCDYSHKYIDRRFFHELYLKYPKCSILNYL